MRTISLDEAVGVIKEWGVDCDNFVAHNYHPVMFGGEPTDNSVEMGEYFLHCLRKVCDLGINAQSDKETIAGLETENFRLESMVSALYHYNDRLVRYFELENRWLIDTLKKFIPRQEE